MARAKRKQPTVYVIAGPNGAGKTTFAADFLPHFARCPEFLNADLIAAGLSPFAPETQNVRAGRLLLQRMKELVNERTDFGLETTLAGRTYIKLLQRMKEKGYRVALFFLWLPSAEVAVDRVQNRARQGGHSVPLEDIHRRYAGGLQNFFRVYRPMAHEWRLFDASVFPPRLVAGKERRQTVVQEKALYQQIEKQAETER